MIFWVGASASPQLLIDLFGVDDIKSIDTHVVSYKPSDNRCLMPLLT